MRQNLDRYVGRSVVGSVLASLVFFTFLMILLDLLKSLGDYLDVADAQGVSTLGLLGFLAGYYLKLVPFLFVTIAPFATVIGCMFAVARLMGQNELQPMLFVGRSMVRILRPALLAGVVVAGAMIAAWQWVVPELAIDIGSAQSFLAGSGRRIEDLVLEQRGASFAGLSVHAYDPALLRMTGVHLLREDKDRGKASLIEASAATWDAALGDWRLENGFRQEAGLRQPCAILGAPEWTPAIVLQRGQDNVPCEQLSYSELLATRAQRPNKRDVAMALHRHFTYPLANVLLLLLALPFAIHYERASRVERVLGAIGVCVAYLTFDLTCQNLGYGGHLQPLVAAWSPTILFGSLGIVMFGSMRT